MSSGTSVPSPAAGAGARSASEVGSTGCSRTENAIAEILKAYMLRLSASSDIEILQAQWSDSAVFVAKAAGTANCCA
jgi:hypothetical protein